MNAPSPTERLQKSLACLEENPPNWFGAALWLRYALYSDGSDFVYRSFKKYVPDLNYIAHDPQAPTLSLDRSLCFVYAVQRGGYHQELVNALRDVLPKPAQQDALEHHTALVKETAALRARIAALEAAMPKQLTPP